MVLSHAHAWRQGACGRTCSLHVTHDCMRQMHVASYLCEQEKHMQPWLHSYAVHVTRRHCNSETQCRKQQQQASGLQMLDGLESCLTLTQLHAGCS